MSDMRTYDPIQVKDTHYHFFKYDNTIPIALGLLTLFLGAGGAFAASPDVRDAMFSSATVVRTVDNSYIVSANLDSFMPRVQIIGVTEDGEHYYVAYTLATIDIVDYVWRDTIKSETMKVSKADLGGRDLGLYVTRQLKEVIDWQVAHLRETQEFEKKVGITPKVVATEYSGLIGKFLDPNEEELPGYTPVVPPDPALPVVTGDTVAEPVIQENSSGADVVGAGSSSSNSVAPSVSSGGDTTPPTITMLGNNPATIQVGTTYSDLGAVITDNVNDNLGYRVTLDGRDVYEVSIDTTVPGEHVITYTATDQAGNTSTATRGVIVAP